MPEYTSKLNLYKPNRADSEITVDTSLSANFQKIDDGFDEVTQQLAQITHQFVDVSKFIYPEEQTINNAFKRAMDYASEQGFKNIYFPKGTWYVDPKGTTPYQDAGLLVQSNFNIHIANDAIIESIGVDVTNYRIFNLQSVENINIYGGTIKGDRATHEGTTGEWGQGIYMNGVRNVNIYGTKVIDCWGDGIYVGLHCEKVYLHNIESTNNRRNNLSLISCKTFRAINCKFDFVNGTSPEAGMDIEPNGIDSDLEDIKFIDCSFIGNKDRGFAINIIMMKDSSKTIDIEIIRPIVKNSSTGISIKPTSGVKGMIRVVEPIVEEIEGRGLWLVEPVIGGCDVIIDKPRFINCKKTQLPNGDARLGGVIVAYNTDNNIAERLGGFEVINPYIDSPKAMSGFSIYDNRTTNQPLTNIKIVDPLLINTATDTAFTSSSYYKQKYYIQSNRENFYFSDRHRKLNKIKIEGTNAMQRYMGYGLFWRGNYFYNDTIENVSTGLMLPETINENEEIDFTFENLGGGLTIRIRNEDGSAFQPKTIFFENDGLPVQSLVTTDKNARITLRPTTDGIVVVSKIGSWAFS